MNQETQGTNDVLMDAVVQKLEQQGQKIQAQEKKIGALEETVHKTPDHSPDIQQVKAGIADLKTVVVHLQFPAEEIKELSRKLTITIDQLQKPIENKIQHHHHVPKITWIAAGLFVILCLTCSGWYATSARLDQFREADTKYRYLYLQGDSVMQQILYSVDSLYRSGYHMRDSVIQWEADQERAVELKRQWTQKQGEGIELRGEWDELDRREKARREGR
jgi:hypothetical protein